MKIVSYIDNFESWKDRFSFYTDIRVRFSETDMFGHMNNVTPFIYFEQARIEFLKQAGFKLGQDQLIGIPIVADLQCDFHKQLFFDDLIKLYVKVHHIGTSSLDIHYMGVDEEGDVCLTGRGAMVYIDPKTKKTISIPDNLKDQLVSLSK